MMAARTKVGGPGNSKRRRRWEDRNIGVSIHAEYLFSFLLGKRGTHGLAGWQDTTSWRHLSHKLVTQLERYIAANIVTDRSHHSDLEHAIQALHGAVDNGGSDRESELVTRFARLCLLLIGGVPNHWDRRIVNRPEHYLLSEHRSVHFSQTPAQIACVIRTKYLEQRNTVLPKADASRLGQEYWRHRRQRTDARFVAMFRQEYPQEYLKLFG
jgi:hypothetical protein